MQRKTVKVMILLLILIGFNGCSKQYESKKAFCADSKGNRTEFIKDVLQENDIVDSNKYAIIFIEYILTESKIYPRIEKLFSHSNFNDFIEKVIPILYYSYSPDNYKHMPKRMKQNVDKYLIYHAPYEFSYGGKNFRESISKLLHDDDSIYRNIVIFDYYSEFVPVTFARGGAEDETSSQEKCSLVWVYGFYVKEFKQLERIEQLKIILYSLKFLRQGRKIEPQERSRYNYLLETWTLHPEELLESYSEKPVTSLIYDMYESVFQM